MKTSMGARKPQFREAVLREKLQSRGAHLTQQSAAVFRFLQQAKHHPTAEEVYLAVKKKLPRISLATVYKNLRRSSPAARPPS